MYSHQVGCLISRSATFCSDCSGWIESVSNAQEQRIRHPLKDKRWPCFLVVVFVFCWWAANCCSLCCRLQMICRLMSDAIKAVLSHTNKLVLLSVVEYLCLSQLNFVLIFATLVFYLWICVNAQHWWVKHLFICVFVIIIIIIIICPSVPLSFGWATGKASGL